MRYALPKIRRSRVAAVNNFEYLSVATPEAAQEALSGQLAARLIVGGTDLIPLMKEGLAAPSKLVDLGPWSAGRAIEETSEGMRVGALATLGEIAANEQVRSRFAALADACGVAASPQLRNMGTIGGNLLQQTRCWYYRGPFDCWLKGGEVCYARNGQNEQHAIFHTAVNESPCVSAHPSDPAAALLALDAQVEYITGEGKKVLPISELYALPTDQRRTVTLLPDDAVITAIVLPDGSGRRRSLYRKAMPRAAYSFALVGIAIALEVLAGTIRNSRVALSGVAPIPVRSTSAEEALDGRSIIDLDDPTVPAAIVSSARPLSMNRYKVELLQGLFKEVLAEITR